MGLGFRILVYIKSMVSQEPNKLVVSASGINIWLIDKDIEILDATTDENGYLLVDNDVFVTLGEEVRISIETPDQNLTAAGTVTIEDVSAY